MTEESPPYFTLEQAKQLNRSLMEKLLDRAASDPTWKQRLLDDPAVALREANFPEIQQIHRMEEQAEVQGHTSSGSDPSLVGTSRPHRCQWTWYCMHWTWRWDQ
jgi:hypothetical protein